MIFLWLLALFPSSLFASNTAHADPVASVIFWGTLIFFLGVMGRYLARWVHCPGVLGELLMGVLIGNVAYFIGLPMAIILREDNAIFQIMGSLLANVPLSEAVNTYVSDSNLANKIIAAISGPQGMDYIKVAYVVDTFSRYGVIFLLFLVGLENSVTQMRQTGRESFSVAIIGVVVPIVLGLVVSSFLMPTSPFSSHLFVAATLCATSVGITARVLKELNQLQTREAKTILGAAMIDDVLGLVILAIITSLVIHGVVSVMMICQIILLALSFFIGALWVGPWVLQHAVRFFSFLSPWEAKLFTAFLFLMCLSWLATVVQLAAIIGAFAAGIIIHDGFFDKHFSVGRETLAIKDLVAPLESLLAPLFFVLIGIQVKIEVFMNPHVLWIAMGLILAAILGKLVSGFGASSLGDRLMIGIGMLPRGEVGLVFASMGKTLNVISDDLFSAIVCMVVVTTLVGPLWLKIRMHRHAVR